MKAVLQSRKELGDKLIYLNSPEIEVVDSFTYLRSIMNTKNYEIIEIRGIILITNTAYFQLVVCLNQREYIRRIK
jgi:hypothetical protein